MFSTIESRFLGIINDVSFENQQNYQTTEYLLGELESTKNIRINDPDFTRELRDTIAYIDERMEGGLDFSELERNVIENIGPEATLKDVQLVNDYGDEFYKSEEFNAKLRNGAYEKAFAHGRDNDDEPLSISSRGMEHKLKAALIERGVDEETISKFTGKHFYKEDSKDILKNIPHQTKKETQMMMKELTHDDADASHKLRYSMRADFIDSGFTLSEAKALTANPKVFSRTLDITKATITKPLPERHALLKKEAHKLMSKQRSR